MGVSVFLSVLTFISLGLPGRYLVLMGAMWGARFPPWWILAFIWVTYYCYWLPHGCHSHLYPVSELWTLFCCPSTVAISVRQGLWNVGVCLCLPLPWLMNLETWQLLSSTIPWFHCSWYLRHLLMTWNPFSEGRTYANHFTWILVKPRDWVLSIEIGRKQWSAISKLLQAYYICPYYVDFPCHQQNIPQLAVWSKENNR